jgi:uncharacterized protein (TIGR03067 family)
MRAIAFALLAGLASLAAGCGKKDGGGGGSSEEDLAALQGTWEIVRIDVPEGEEVASPDVFKTVEYTVKGNLITATEVGERKPGYAIFTLDASKSPRELDLTGADENGNPVPSKEYDGGDPATGKSRYKEGPPPRVHAIYKIEGDTLMVAARKRFGAPRPTDFRPATPELGEHIYDWVAVIHLRKK